MFPEIASYGNYSKFGFIHIWTESSCCGVYYYPENFLIDLVILIPLLIIGYYTIKIIYKKVIKMNEG